MSLALTDIVRIAEKAIEHFGLQHKKIEELPATHKDFGDCDDEGIIRIRLYRRGTKIPLADSTILDTIAHEIAHLDRRGWHHGRAHQKLTKEILEELHFIYDEETK